MSGSSTEPAIGSPIDRSASRFRTWYSNYEAVIDNWKGLSKNIENGGGLLRIEREHKRGKFTARERIDALVDDPRQFAEIGKFAGFEMYEEEGGCPAGGTIVGIAPVSGRLCVLVANDATVKAGAWFPITVRKNIRAQELALENRIPIIYLVDSAGVYLPMQDEIFPDRDHFGRIFRNNAQLSGLGVPQIAAIMGSCVAGGAYLPIMSDEALIVDGTGSVFLAGPFLVRAAIGEDVDVETLGGAETHSAISGVTDYRAADDSECLQTVRRLVGQLGPFDRAGFTRDEPADPESDADEILGLIPADAGQPYDTREILARLIDGGSFTEYKREYGQTIVTGYARIDGWNVGIVANQRKVVRTKGGEMQVGGVIYSDSADKAARFVMNCNQKKLPIVFLQDVTGFMVGTRAEQGGIIKDGAKMVNAVANTVTPKFTIVTGNSYGAGNYAMCGRAYDPRLMLAWPSARIAVMGGTQAANTLLQIEMSKLKKGGQSELSDAERDELKKRIEERYEAQTSPYYAAARMWIDEIIDPRDTRRWISLGIEMADHNPVIPRFNPGVLQT